MEIDKEQFRKVCETSLTMAQAAVALGLHFNTFKRYALKLGCYNPNQSGKGLSKPQEGTPLQEILDGKHPSFQTGKLKRKLLKEGLKENICEVCGIEEWNGKPIVMELDHINGIRYDHSYDNLRMVCPNCHSQTDTFRGKNIECSRRNS